MEQIKYPTELKDQAIERVLKLHCTRNGIKQYSIAWLLDKLTDEKLAKLLKDVKEG